MVAYVRLEKIFLFAGKFRQQPNREGEIVTFRSWHDAFHYLTHVWRITSSDLDWNVFKMAFKDNIQTIFIVLSR